MEIITDIGNHILAERFRDSESTYKGIILSLGKYGVIPKDFSEQNAPMTDFRNLLIHVYEDVNMEQVYENLQKSPDIFREFARYYVEFFDTIEKTENEVDLFS